MRSTTVREFCREWNCTIFPPCLSKKVPALCRQSGFTDLSNIELATALRDDEGRRLDGPLCRLEERLATLQTGRNYLPRSCVWLPHAAFCVSSAGIGGSIISFGELAHAASSASGRPAAISRVRIEWNIAEWSVARFSPAICVVSAIGELFVWQWGQRVATLSRHSEKGVARAESGARKIVCGRDAFVANRRLCHRSHSRISKVSGVRLSHRRRRHHRRRCRNCCSETSGENEGSWYQWFISKVKHIGFW